MFRFKFLSFIVLLSVPLFLGFDDCQHKEAKSAEKIAGEKKTMDGNYSAALPKTPGFLKIELRENATAKILNIVSQHLPPVEIENTETKYTHAKDGSLCFEVEPKTIEQCAISANQNEIVVKLKPDGDELKLIRIKDQ